MKQRTLQLLACALMAGTLLLAVGCGKDEDASSGVAPESLSVSGEDVSGESVSGEDVSGESVTGELVVGAGDSGGEAADGSGAASGAASGADAAASAAPLAPVSMSGNFLCLDENRYPDERAPLITLQEDGSFTLRLNLGDGLGEMTGTYTRAGAALTLSIADRDNEDYLGADINELTFTMLDEDHMNYTGGAVGMTRAGDQFTREGMQPMTSAPASVAATPADMSAASGAAGEADASAASASAPASASAE